MARTVKEQVQSGLQLAGGIVLFVICLLLVAYGLDSVWPDSSSSHAGSSGWVGWVELTSAAFLIPFTMHLWLQFFAGCSLFACLNAIWVLFAGKGLHLPHPLYSRLEAIEVGVFFAIALLWSARFAKKQPTIPDRIAITIYVFFVFMPPGPHFSAWNIGGLAALLLSWALYRWAERKTAQ